MREETVVFILDAAAGVTDGKIEECPRRCLNSPDHTDSIEDAVAAAPLSAGLYVVSKKKEVPYERER